MFMKKTRKNESDEMFVISLIEDHSRLIPSFVDKDDSSELYYFYIYIDLVNLLKDCIVSDFLCSEEKFIIVNRFNYCVKKLLSYSHRVKLFDRFFIFFDSLLDTCLGLEMYESLDCLKFIKGETFLVPLEK